MDSTVLVVEKKCYKLVPNFGYHIQSGQYDSGCWHCSFQSITTRDKAHRVRVLRGVLLEVATSESFVPVISKNF